MRKPVTSGIVAISCMTAFPAVNRIALGQAGSTGGAVGKTDKSASRGEDLDAVSSKTSCACHSLRSRKSA
jgi:hypothetical protein